MSAQVLHNAISRASGVAYSSSTSLPNTFCGALRSRRVRRDLEGRQFYLGVTPRKFLGDHVTLVPRAIVDNDEFEFQIVGCNIENTLDACLQRPLFTITRHHKRERLWRIRSHELVFRLASIGGAGARARRPRPMGGSETADRTLGGLIKDNQQTHFQLSRRKNGAAAVSPIFNSSIC